MLIQYAAQGGWSITLRRVGENVIATLPVFALLFVPMLLGLHALYSLDRSPGPPSTTLCCTGNQPYLNEPFFLIRAALYFVIWCGIALPVPAASRSQDATGDPAVSARLRRFAGPALIVLALTRTFAAFDWIMSLDAALVLDDLRRLLLRRLVRGDHRAARRVVSVAMRGGGTARRR